MKTLPIILLPAICICVARGEDPPPNDRPVELDLKALPAEDGWVGLDFRVDLDFDRKDAGEGTRWSGFFRSRGFLTPDPDRNDMDSLSASLGFDLDPLWRVNPVLPGNIPRVTPDNAESFRTEDFRRFAPAAQAPLSVYFEGLGKFESTQDFDTWNLAVGGALAITTSWLHPLLDLPFEWLHDDHNSPRQFDLSLGYDRLLSQTRDSEFALGRNRLVLAAEFETGIGRSDRLRLTFAAHHDLDGGTAEGGEFHPFFEARYMHLLVDRPEAEVAFSIKWTTGELPPAYVEGQVIGAGFSIEF